MELKDSGKREKFDTGAVRDLSEGKGRFDLISPIFLKRLALLYENGALKYSDRNWEKGISISRCFDSAMRHLNQYREGHRDEDHLVQSAWNLISAIHFLEMVDRGLLDPSLKDFPTYLTEKPKEEKLVIAIDLDDVILDTANAIVCDLNSGGYYTLPRSEITEFNISKFSQANPKIVEDVVKIVCNRDDLKPLDSTVVDTVNKLSRMHDVYIVTNRDNKTDWTVKENLQNIGVDVEAIQNIIFVDKGIDGIPEKLKVLEGIKADFFIEDRPDTILDVWNNSTSIEVYVRDCPWNQEVDGSMYRIFKLSDFLDYI